MATFAPPTTGPYTVANVLGPAITGGIGAGILQGLLFCHTATYFSESKDGRPLKGMVGFVNFMALFQTILLLGHLWNLLVDCYGNYLSMLNFDWMTEIQPVVSTLMSAPVQFYFIRRAWKLSSRNWYLGVFNMSLLALSVVTSIVTTALIVILAQFPFDQPPPSAKYIVTFLVSWNASSAVLDVSLTSLLLTYLIRSRTNIHSKDLETVVDRLIAIVWQSAAPPCLCAVTIITIWVVSYGQGANSYWTDLPTHLLGKLYCISLMVTLNSRSDVSNSRSVTTESRQPTAGPHSFQLRSVRVPQPRASSGTTLARDSTQISDGEKSKGVIGVRSDPEVALDDFPGVDEATENNQWPRVHADQKSWVDAS